MNKVIINNNQTGKNSKIDLEDNIEITGCDGNGCYLDIEGYSLSVYAYCNKNYVCIFEDKTEEQRKIDGNLDKEWNLIIGDTLKETIIENPEE